MKQKPFTKAQAVDLFANAAIAAKTGESRPPVVKFFCPWGAATWLISEAEMIDGDSDIRFFGLCDLGMGEPELGYVLLSELQGIKHWSGLTIERDLHFRAEKGKTLADYADEARANRRIVA